jgi:hypothetical protein
MLILDGLITPEIPLACPRIRGATLKLTHFWHKSKHADDFAPGAGVNFIRPHDPVQLGHQFG